MDILRAAAIEQDKEAFKAAHPEVVAWLENYRGNFDFYRQLQGKYNTWGNLSPAQRQAVERAIERDKARAEAAARSAHLGAVGDRLRGNVEVKATFDIETRYGESTIYVFEDEHGNQLKWFTGSNPGISKGQKGILEGTVKKHDEYRGAKQTILTRCKFQEAA